MDRDGRARARRAAASLVNSVLRCSWYLVTRCLSEIRAARTRGGEQQPRDSDAVTRLWEARRASRRLALPRLVSPPLASRLRRHIMPACARRCRRQLVRTTSSRLDSTRLDSIRLDSTRLKPHVGEKIRSAPPIAITPCSRPSDESPLIVNIPTLTLFAMRASAVTEIAHRVFLF